MPGKGWVVAFDITRRGAFSGRSRFGVMLYWRRDVTDAANNRAKYAWEARAENYDNSTATYALGDYSWTVWVGGQKWSGSRSLDFRGGQSYLVLGTGVTGWITHDGNGDLNVAGSVSMGPASIFGSASASGTLVADRISHPAPTGLSVSRVSDSHMSLSWSLSSSYSSVLVQRRTDGGSWQQVGAPSGSA